MAAANPRLAELSDDERQVVECWLIDFDQGWDEGILAGRVEHIPPGSLWRLPALAEMVKIDLERQWQHGRRVSLESYLEQFPELGRPEDVSADLIQAEYEVRREFGAPAALEDYLRRFPHQAAELARLIDRGESAAPDNEPPRTDPWLPATFGRYTIIKRLGQGGMGSVYLAEDTQLGRRVALKVPDFGRHESPAARKRFLAEARAAATLDHPYLCPVFDVGEIDGRLYLTMAYIQGQSLAALIGAQGWPEGEAAGLVGKLALAMQEAHAKKVIHRDLKPANVMIKTTGQGREPVIVDFGLAYRDDPEEQRLTSSGQVMGTPAYMAPEQIRGNLEEIGPACDIYALGVILYTLLTGRLPFNGSRLAVACQILTEAPSPPSKHRGDLDPALEAICQKAMAKQVGDRYASMSELAAAVTDYLRFPSTTSTPGPTARVPTSQVPRPTRTETLVPRFFGRILSNHALASTISNPEPVASPVSMPERHWPPWPIIIAAVLFVVSIFGVIVYGPTHNRRAVVTGDKARSPATKPGTGHVSAVPLKQIVNSMGMKLVLIPSGEFLMGSPDSDEDAQGGETPQHPVRISRPFYLGATEVTVAQFRRVVNATGFRTDAEADGKGGDGWNEAERVFEQDPKYTWRNPGFAQTDEDPVVNVSWNDAIAFCNRLGEIEGLKPYYHPSGKATPSSEEGYRLPTEAEWEYACRAGSTTRYCFSDDPASLGQFAWYSANSDNKTHPVGQMQSNAWGLFDMHGNVWEWCWDWYDRGYYGKSVGVDPVGPSVVPDAAYRVSRGGCWAYDPQSDRSACRDKNLPRWAPSNQGFRVARVLFVPRTAALKPGSRADLTASPKTITDSIGMKLALIPAGEFLMGAPDADQDAHRDQKPQHPVLITRPFYLAVHEVTHDQYRAVTGAAPNAFKGSDTLPVESVSWFDAIAFCNELSRKESLTLFYLIDGPQVEVPDWDGTGYRLPTEVEWEYACRAGSVTRFCFGDDAAGLGAFAWHGGNSGKCAHPVGQKRPNAWGLYDMHGNVAEWCWDGYAAHYYQKLPGAVPLDPSEAADRLIRGGDWGHDPRRCRSAYRGPGAPGLRVRGGGFRVARFQPGR